MVTSLDLFSGYGGISYALKEYVKPIAYCEIDNYARGILASRISEGELCFAPIFADVRNIKGQVGSADIITGGFPCQDISIAGLGTGLGGKRSGLFFEIVRLTKEIRPAFVFLENVPAIRTRGLREVVGAFAKMGYDCRWTCLSAASVGAPHKRERWFLLAYAKSERCGEARQLRCHESTQRITGGSEKMADTNGKRLERLSETKISRRKGRIEAVNASLQERQFWSSEPNVGRVANGTPFRVDRIKALGNGVVPLQVKTAFERLIGIHPQLTNVKEK